MKTQLQLQVWTTKKNGKIHPGQLLLLHWRWDYTPNDELFDMFIIVEWVLLRRFLKGRDHSCRITPVYIPFTLLETIKRRHLTVLHGKIRILDSNFRSLLWSIMETITDVLLDCTVVDIEIKARTQILKETGCQILHHPWHQYATDMRFHQSTSPSGSPDNIKYWYSEKNTFDLNKEVSVKPTRLCIHKSKQQREIFPDITMFWKRSAWHKSALRNTGNDVVETCSKGEFPVYWSRNVDKRYRGLQKWY